MAKVIKEIIIILLICLVSMLIFAILLYDYIPNRKIVAEVSQYQASPEVETLLADNIDSKENEIVLTYEVTSKDLNNYEAKNEYVKGKANPFAAATKTTVEDGDGNITGNTTESNNTNNANNTSNSNGDIGGEGNKTTANSTEEPTSIK